MGEKERQKEMREMSLDATVHPSFSQTWSWAWPVPGIPWGFSDLTLEHSRMGQPCRMLHFTAASLSVTNKLMRLSHFLTNSLKSPHTNHSRNMGILTVKETICHWVASEHERAIPVEHKNGSPTFLGRMELLSRYKIRRTLITLPQTLKLGEVLTSWVNFSH